MALRGAQKGNKNAVKAKEWERALKAELHHYEDKDRKVERGTALAAIAKKCIEQALDGDKDARTEIANRLDGKPREHVEIDYTQRLAEELTDDELIQIVRDARGSSDPAADEAQRTEDPSGIH
jgi:hypothetical protein